MTIVISLILEYDHVITNTCWLAVKVNVIPISVISYNTFIAWRWGKYENLFSQVCHIPRGQCPRWIWYSWVNTFSYFLYPHAITILLYRMQPRKHMNVKYCWQHILSPLERCLRHIKTTSIVTVACKWCVPSASDVFLSKNDSSGGKIREASEGVEYDFYFTEYDFCPYDHVSWFLPIVQSN